MPLFCLALAGYLAGLLCASALGHPSLVLLLGMSAAALAWLSGVSPGAGRSAGTLCLLATLAGVVVGSIPLSAPAHCRSAGAADRHAVARCANAAGAEESTLERAREAASRRIDLRFGPDAPMVRALVVGDMSAIDTAERDLYARAGLVHMLSVSGLHVGIVAMALALLASVCRLPLLVGRVLAVATVALYVAAIGAPPPAVRAAVMIGAVLVCRSAQRPTSPWSVLALGAVAPLFSPAVALDLGYQLSVAGTAALVAGAALARRVVPATIGSVGRGLCTGIIISVVATLVTAPLVALTFGRVALLGPISNLLADPIMGLLQPLLFLALMLPAGAVAGVATDAAHALLSGFHGIASHAAAVPFAAPVLMPSWIAAACAAAAAVALMVACCAERPAAFAIVSAAGFAGLLVLPLVPRIGAVPELHLIDVGQGDAMALRTSRGRWIVMDAGRAWRGGDAGARTVAPYLARRGGEVAVFIISHPHDDHVGGAASLLRAMRPGLVIDPGYVGLAASYRATLAAAGVAHVPWERVRPGRRLQVDDVVLEFLAPDSAWASGLHDANLASTMVMATLGGSRVLLTGDAEAPEEQWVLGQRTEALRAEVLKVAHHGSRTSTTSAFLNAVHPRLALISVGAANVYGHPDAEVLDRLRDDTIPVLRTDQMGSIVLRFRGQVIEVRTATGRWTLNRSRRGVP